MCQRPCPHCRAPIRADAFEPAHDAQRLWLACPACDALIPLPGQVAAEDPDDASDREYALAGHHN